MNRLIARYLYDESHFEDALILTERSELQLEELQRLCRFPKSWFELSRLSVDDRIDFTKQFWLKELPFHSSFFRGIDRFFDRLDDVGPVLLLDGGWTPRLFYSLKDESAFFCGDPPAEMEVLHHVIEQCAFPFPRSWRAFMRIHNGFGKLLDRGLLSLADLEISRKTVMQMVMQTPLYVAGRLVDPEALFPFYEVSGWHSFHCFFANWFPEGEMGTVYFSGIDYTISDMRARKLSESGAYPCFGEWLIAFLEGAEMSL